MVISRSTHVARKGIISFFLMAEEYFIVCIYHIFFIHPSDNGYVVCFHQGWSACVFSNYDFSQHIGPEVGFPDHVASLILVF